MESAASDSRTSSPDPLALSYDDGDTQHPMSSPRRAAPLRESSPNKQSPKKRANTKANASARRQTQTARLSTPARSPEKATTPASHRSVQTFRVNTPNDPSGRQGSSPLKIRVTVETEPDEMGEDYDSPTHRGTRTMKIPLKDSDTGGNPPKRRGRPRKSEAHLLQLDHESLDDNSSPAGVVLGKRRRATPAKLAATRPRHSTTQSSNASAGDESRRSDAIFTTSEEPEEDIGTVAASVESPPADQIDGTTDIYMDAALPLQAPQTRARKPIDFSALTPLHKKPENALLTQTPNMAELMKDTSGARSVSGRVPTPRKPPGWQDQDDNEQDDVSYAVSTEGEQIEVPSEPQVQEDEAQPTQESMTKDSTTLNVSGWDASFPDDSSMREDDVARHDDVDALDDTVALNRSAVESEGFSMVSIEALKQQRQLAEKDTAKDRRSTQVDRLSMPEPLGQQAASSGLRIRPRHGRQDTTPLQIEEVSPSPPPLLPSPLKQSPTRKISPVVRAGSVLQEALSSPPVASRSRSPQARNNLFAGFGDGTQKQLRRGIAMGELLSRAEPGFQTSTARVSPYPSQPTRDQTPAAGRLLTPDDSLSSLNAPGSAEHAAVEASVGPQQDAHPPTGRNRSYDEMSWRPTTLPRQGLTATEYQQKAYDAMSWRPTTPPATNENASDESRLSHSQKQDLQYQREREEVIRQAREANSSQIMVIESSVIAPSGAGRAGAMSRMTLRDEDGDAMMRDASLRQSVRSEAPQVSDQQKSPSVQLEDIFLDEADRSLEDSMNSQARRRGKQPAKVFQPPKDDNNEVRDPDSLLRELPQHTPDFNDILGPDDRPMRGKLPRTWRRTSGSALLYSDETGATPDKQARSIPQVTEKRTGDALSSPNKDDDVPTVFKRFRSSPRDQQETPTKSSPSRNKRKTVLSSPSRQSSPSFRSSPPKEVRFADGNGSAVPRRASGADEDYFSSGDEGEFSDEGGFSNDEHGEDGIEQTFIGAGDDNSAHDSDEETTVLDHSRVSATTDVSLSKYDTSDVRQLKREMRSMDFTLDTSTSDVRQLRREMLSDEESEGSESEEEAEEEDEESTTQPPARRAKAMPAMNLSPRKDRRQSDLFGNTRPGLSSVASLAPKSILKNPLPPAPPPGPSFLARAASWFWPPAYFTSAAAASATATQPPLHTTNLKWNKNHRILLRHYYNLAHNIPSSGPPMPAAYRDNPIPDACLRFYIGKPFTTRIRCLPSCPPNCPFPASLVSPDKEYSALFTERQARIAWAFMAEVERRGVPLISGEDGTFELSRPPAEYTGEKPGIVRDARTGRVARRREVWSATDVALSVFVMAIAPVVERDRM